MLFVKTVVLEFVLFLFVGVYGKGPPVLIKPIKKQYVVKEGETVKLQCKVSGIKDPAANRTLTAWQKLPERRVITSNEDFKRFTMIMGRYLRIKKVTLSDGGIYVCIAKNSYGTIRHNISLIVQGFNSSTQGSFLNATAKRPPQKGSPRISNIPLIDGSPPQFRKPRNRISEYAEGQPISLKCHAFGEPPLTITWTKAGRKLSKSQRSYLASKGRVLRFRNLSFGDSGTYTCKVENEFGSIQRTFEIKVVDSRRGIKARKPIISKRDLKNETVYEGDNVTFVCSAVSESHPEFSWCRWNVSNRKEPQLKPLNLSDPKFREIRESAREYDGYGNIYTHRLIVLNVRKEDQAKYTCIVGNSAGYVSEHAILTVSRKDGEAYGVTAEGKKDTEAPTQLPKQFQTDLLVDDVPLAALIGVPVAVVIVLIGTIVWCYFMTTKHRALHKVKETQHPPQQRRKSDLPSKCHGEIVETRNVSKNVYVDCPNETIGLPKPCYRLQSAPGSGSKKFCSRLQVLPPLDGLIPHTEPTHSSRTRCDRHQSDNSEAEPSGSDSRSSDI